MDNDACDFELDGVALAAGLGNLFLESLDAAGCEYRLPERGGASHDASDDAGRCGRCGV